MRKKRAFHIISLTMFLSLLFTNINVNAMAYTAVKETNVTKIILNKSTLTLPVRGTENLTVTTDPGSSADLDVKWTSSDSKVAEVNNGVVTGVGEGTVVITAAAADGSCTDTCTVTVYSDSIVTFKDKGLENAVRDALKKTSGDLCRSDVSDITYLNANSKAIYDISGIENLISLKHLELYSNEISDIAPLSSLTELQILDLNGNKITDISGLKGLVNLTEVDLSYNQISDISTLSGLANLTSIDLYVNRISNISALEGLTNLRYINLKDNKVRIPDIRYLKSACLITVNMVK